jgi:hypothetical protein
LIVMGFGEGMLEMAGVGIAAAEAAEDVEATGWVAVGEFDVLDVVGLSLRLWYVWPYGVGPSQLSPGVTGSLGVILF